jgi:hypothetical protein
MTKIQKSFLAANACMREQSFTLPLKVKKDCHICKKHSWLPSSNYSFEDPR